MSNSSRVDTFEALSARYGGSYRWLITATVMMGTISTILSATTINVALPEIMGAFGIGQERVQLLSTAFFASMTAFMLLNAWMVDTFGHRMTYFLAISVFIIASFVGGMTNAEGILIVARVSQGAAAGILQPLAMQVIFQVFPPEKRGMAMGMYGFGIVLAPAVGPALGGIIIDSFSWRYVFFMAIPFSVAGLFLAMIFLPGRSTTGAPRQFDWLGFALMAVFLFSLLTALSNGQRYGWMSDRILCFLALAFLTGGGFILWELHARSPMLNLKLYANRIFVGASVVGFIFGAVFFATTFLVPVFAQTIQQYTPTRSGFLLMPAGLVLAFVFIVAGRLSDLLSAHIMLTFGLLLFALSSFLLTNVDTNTPFWLFAWWIIIGRIGLGFVMPSLSVAAMRALPGTMISQGAGAINFMHQLGAALGINLVSVMVEWRTGLYVQCFTVSQNAANSATGELMRGVVDLYARIGVPEAIRSAGAIDYLGIMIYTQGSMMGFRDGFLILAVASLVALIPALMMRASPRAGGDAVTPPGPDRPLHESPYNP